MGALRQVAGAWSLDIPAEGNAILEGGAFAVIVPNNPWAWVSGTATLPAGLAGILARKVGLASLVGRNLLLSPSSLLKSFSNGDSRDALDQTKSKSLSKNKNLINRDEGDKEKTKQKSLSTQSQSAAAGPDVAIVDAVITGNLLQAASGPKFLLKIHETLHCHWLSMGLACNRLSTVA